MQTSAIIKQLFSKPFTAVFTSLRISMTLNNFKNEYLISFSGKTQLKSVSENIVQIEQTPLNDDSAHFLKYDLQSSAKN